MCVLFNDGAIVSLDTSFLMTPRTTPPPPPKSHHPGQRSASYISAVKYHAPAVQGPALPALAAADGQPDTPPLLAPSHIDGGLLTVIYSTQPGFQVRSGDGQWEDVPAATPEQRRLVVLVGAQLERATGGALRAVQHRVIATATDDASNLPRQSLVFRLRAHRAAVLDPMPMMAK